VKWIGIALAFIWGIGQNLPWDNLYLKGISPADFLFLGVLGVLLCHAGARQAYLAEVQRLMSLLSLIACFVTLTAVSSAVNAFTWGFQSNDLVEMVRPLYYFLIIAFVAMLTRRHGLGLLLAFVAGIVASGVVAYLRPASQDVLGFVMLWNPNVIGNMLALGVLFSSLLILGSLPLPATACMLVCMVLSIFTYSKGTWLMVLLGLVACLIALRATGDPRVVRAGRYILGTAVIGLGLVVFQHWDALYTLVSFKLETTQLGDTAAEGGTTAARWGFVVASMVMAVDSPVLGVGISNFESAYRTLQPLLGNAYWSTDNPHSAWLYILACIGVPALVIFALIFARTLLELARRVPLQGSSRLLYVALFCIVLFLSGAVMLQLLTQYFFWFLTGVLGGWQPQPLQPGRQAT